MKFQTTLTKFPSETQNNANLRSEIYDKKGGPELKKNVVKLKTTQTKLKTTQTKFFVAEFP